jgi:heptosyltransferase-3
MNQAVQSAPRTALVIALRYLGDVLFVTPFVAALHERYPDCAIDMLVFAGCEGMLQGNPAVRRVIATPERAPRGERIALLRETWRRYDLAVSTSPSDRSFLHAFAAGRRRIGFLPHDRRMSRAIQRALFTRSAVFRPEAHRLAHNDVLAELAGLAATGRVQPPAAGEAARDWRALLGHDPQLTPLAVVHPSPRWRYKRWPDAGWRAVIDHLQARGLRVAVTGGPGDEERRYLDRVCEGLSDVQRLDGALRLGELAELLARARVFIGPDTATTHMAAGSGTPTVAIFGPTDPTIWGPARRAADAKAYVRVSALQRSGRVTVVQNPDIACVPCMREGCDRHRNSSSDCLERLPPARVLAAIDAALEGALAESAA